MSDLRDQFIRELQTAAHWCIASKKCTPDGCLEDPATTIVVTSSRGDRVVSVEGQVDVLADAVMRVIEPALLRAEEDECPAWACNACGCPKQCAPEQVAATERGDTLAGRLQQAEAAVERVRKLAEELASHAPADDWGDSMAATVAADVARGFLAALDRPVPPATAQQDGPDREETT